MGIQIELVGGERLRRKARTFRADTQRSAADEIQHHAQLIRADMYRRALSGGKLSAIAMGSVRLTDTLDGASFVGGAGSGLPATVFKGSEFGGRRRRKRYANRRGENWFVVSRRTTMMFRRYVGDRGYFFHPAIRAGVRGLSRQIMDAAAKAVTS